MSNMKIIPAIDLMDGQCVRLRQGDFAEKKVYGADPLAMAQGFEAAGLTALHLVDLDGAKTGSPGNLEVLRAICRETGLVVDYGGGLRRREDVAAALDAGAQQVTVGSVAVKRPDLMADWLAEFGAERFILGADARGGKVAASGWQEGTAVGLEEFIGKWLALGVKDVLCTAIERDGMLTGPDTGLYKRLLGLFPDMRLIASGGVSSVEDLKALDKAGLWAVVVGKAYYEGRISLAEMEALC